MNPFGRYAGLAAALAFALAVLGFGAALDGYAQQVHPVALLGASGIAHAAAFNVLAFILPGAIAAWLAWRLRDALPVQVGLPARLGWRLVFLSALAFAAQGLLPLDPIDLDARPSRLHAVAWMLWWIAFVPGAGLLAWSALVARPRRLAAFATHVVAAGCVLGFVWLPGEGIAAGIAQRIAFAAWFGWLAWAGYAGASPAAANRA